MLRGIAYFLAEAVRRSDRKNNRQWIALFVFPEKTGELF